MMLPRVLARSLDAFRFLPRRGGAGGAVGPAFGGSSRFFRGFFRLLVSIFARVPSSSIPLEFGVLLRCGASDPLR
jgi:hypothetical protein